MKIIAKEITLWIKDPFLSKLDENEAYNFSQSLEKLNFIKYCLINTHKQLIVTYDTNHISQSELITLLKISLKSYLKSTK